MIPTNNYLDIPSLWTVYPTAVHIHPAILKCPKDPSVWRYARQHASSVTRHSMFYFDVFIVSIYNTICFTSLDLADHKTNTDTLSILYGSRLTYVMFKHGFKDLNLYDSNRSPYKETYTAIGTFRSNIPIFHKSKDNQFAFFNYEPVTGSLTPNSYLKNYIDPITNKLKLPCNILDPGAVFFLNHEKDSLSLHTNNPDPIAIAESLNIESRHNLYNAIYFDW